MSPAVWEVSGVLEVEEGLQAGMGVRIGEGKLVHVPLHVETDGEGQHVAIFVLRRLVVVHVLWGHPRPESEGEILCGTGSVLRIKLVTAKRGSNSWA